MCGSQGRGVVGLLLCVLMLSACTLPVSRAPQKENLYTIRPGETLYSVAWRYGQDYKHVARWNGLEPPYTIYPGQRIRLNPPPAGVATKSRKVVTASKPAKNQQKQKQKQTVKKPAKVAKAPVVRPQVKLRWIWPTQGDVIRKFATPGSAGGKGIDIAGREGQTIKAASNGKVVYSGSGLIGYGRLIIIKHDANYLSAYAHNRKLLVQEGAQVKLGQKIAELGNSGADRSMLHFEIRRDGKPVDPLKYLPVR